MAKFLSDEYFAMLQDALTQDPKWTESTKTVRTSVALGVTDIGQYYVLSAENGVTTLQKSAQGAASEFSFDGSYETWSRIAKGELDLQSAVLKGQLKFKGSLTKILMYRERFSRIADVIKQVPKDF